MNVKPIRHSLLIVDDDPLIREGLAVAFEGDFHVYLAESRVTAVTLLRTLASPSLPALIDLGLPTLPHRPDEGFQLIAELLAHSSRIRIFTLSGQDEESNARHTRALSAVDFIAKPCAPADILWEQYGFPGNTRELRNIVIRLAAKYPGMSISAAQFLDEFDTTAIVAPAFKYESGRTSARERLQSGHFDLGQELRTQESGYIDAALELNANNISEAAKLLGINRTTLYSRMDAHEKLKLEN